VTYSRFHFQILAFVILFISAINSIAAYAQADTLKLNERFRFLRADENYDDATVDELSVEPFGKIKKIALSGSNPIYLTVGGDYRLRYEHSSNQDFGLNGDFSSNALNHRFMVHGDLQTSKFRTFTQLSAFEQGGNIDTPSPTAESSLDIHQSFIDFTPNLARIRVGRQELSLGSGKKTGIREGPNQRRAFDGLRITLNAFENQTDIFYLKEVQPNFDSFNDSSTYGAEFYGIYFNCIYKFDYGVKFDLFYFGFERDQGIYVQGIEEENRQSVGARLYRTQSRIEFDYEFTYQFGSFGDADLSAWGVVTETTYGFQQSVWSPRVGIRINAASGDNDSADGTLGTYNALFPNPTYLSDAAIIQPGNELDLQIFVRFHPIDNLSIFTGIDFLWRLKSGDALYGVPGVPLVPAGGSDNNLAANFFNFIATYTLSPYVTLQGGYVFNQAKDIILEANGINTNFAFTQIAMRF